ncbi:hypothetical protein Tco_0395216, partial [Tanacetum coccineum]
DLEHLEIINQAQSLRHLVTLPSCGLASSGPVSQLELGTSTTILNSLHKTVSNKADGRIWLCHSPRFGWSNLQIREDRPVIR